MWRLPASGRIFYVCAHSRASAENLAAAGGFSTNCSMRGRGFTAPLTLRQPKALRGSDRPSCARRAATRGGLPALRQDVARPMQLSRKTIVGPVGRLGAAAQNALEVARFGGLTTDERPSPYEIEAEHRVYRLRHYYPPSDSAPPLLLVPPMMLAAEIYDVSQATSAVTLLRGHGVDPWVVDFGAPEREEGGLERTLADHVLAVSDAVDRVREATGRDVHLG